MVSTLLAVVMDAQDAGKIAEFWGKALGRTVAERNRGEFIVGDPGSDGGGVLYVMAVPEQKTGKNRVHVDLLAPGGLDEEVQRLTGLGATLVEVRRDDDTLDNPDVWAVLQDPEGNEFCVSSRTTMTGWWTSTPRT
jgi:hypothetical protein